MIIKYFKGYRDSKYKEQVYNTQEDFENLIKEHDYFHDWELVHLCVHSAEKLQFTLKSYKGYDIDEKYYTFQCNGIIWDYAFDFDIGNRYVYEINIRIGKTIVIGIDGVGITITAKELSITTSEQIDSFPDGVEFEII